MHLEALPSYAPDLNPDEGVWNWLKRVALKNQCFANVPALETQPVGSGSHLGNQSAGPRGLLSPNAATRCSFAPQRSEVVISRNCVCSYRWNSFWAY